LRKSVWCIALAVAASRCAPKVSKTNAEARAYSNVVYIGASAKNTADLAMQAPALLAGRIPHYARLIAVARLMQVFALRAPGCERRLT